MLGAETEVTPILMAKMPRIGRVKTRLIAGEGLTAEAAAEVAWAMLECIASRLAGDADLMLAVTPDGCGEEVAQRLGLAANATVVDQGPGDLGQRMARVWRQAGPGRSVAFFGGDSPDVPEGAVAEIPEALAEADLAVGPTRDGGYWTLAARGYHPSVVGDIDWGTGSVYDQTLQRAASAGLVIRALPAWHDVDRPEDIDALLGRVSRSDEPPLQRLADRLRVILQP